VSNRRAWRSGRLVEVHDARLGSNEHRQGDDRLRDRRQPHDPSTVAARRDSPTPIDDPSRGERNGPSIDLAKCLHVAR